MAIKSIVALTVQLMAADPNVNGVDGACHITYNSPPIASEVTANAAICAAWVDPAPTKPMAANAFLQVLTPAELQAAVATPAGLAAVLQIIASGNVNLAAPATATALATMGITPTRQTAILATPVPTANVQ